MNKNIKYNLPTIGVCIILGLVLWIFLYKRFYKHKEGLYTPFDIKIIIKDGSRLGELGASDYEVKSHRFDGYGPRDKVDNKYLGGSHPTHYLRKGRLHSTVKTLPLYVDNNYYIPENCESALLVVEKDGEKYSIVKKYLNDGGSPDPNMLMCSQAKDNYRIEGIEWKGTRFEGEDIGGDMQNRCVLADDGTFADELNDASVKSVEAANAKLAAEIAKNDATIKAARADAAATAADVERIQDKANKMRVKMATSKAAGAAAAAAAAATGSTAPAAVAAAGTDGAFVRKFFEELINELKGSDSDIDTTEISCHESNNAWCGGSTSKAKIINDMIKGPNWKYDGGVEDDGGKEWFEDNKDNINKFLREYHDRLMTDIGKLETWLKALVPTSGGVDVNVQKLKELNIELKKEEDERAASKKKITDLNTALSDQKSALRKGNKQIKQAKFIKRAVSKRCPAATGQGMDAGFSKFMAHLKGIKDIEKSVKDKICPRIQNINGGEGFCGSILGDCNKFNKDFNSWNIKPMKCGSSGTTFIN